VKKPKEKETHLTENKSNHVSRQPEAARDPRPGHGDKKLDGPNIPST
jgi:hypothetical protein